MIVMMMMMMTTCNVGDVGDGNACGGAFLVLVLVVGNVRDVSSVCAAAVVMVLRKTGVMVMTTMVIMMTMMVAMAMKMILTMMRVVQELM